MKRASASRWLRIARPVARAMLLRRHSVGGMINSNRPDAGARTVPRHCSTCAAKFAEPCVRSGRPVIAASGDPCSRMLVMDALADRRLRLPTSRPRRDCARELHGEQMAGLLSAKCSAAAAPGSKRRASAAGPPRTAGAPRCARISASTSARSCNGCCTLVSTASRS